MSYAHYLKFYGQAIAFIKYLKLLFAQQHLLLVHVSSVNFAFTVSPAERVNFTEKFEQMNNKTNRREVKSVKVTRSQFGKNCRASKDQ